MRFAYFSIEYLEPISSGNGALARMQIDELIRQGHDILIFCGNEYGKQKNELEQKHLSIISIPINSKKTLGPESDYIGFNHGILFYIDEIIKFQPQALVVDDWHSATAVIALKYILKIPIIYQFFRNFSPDPLYIPDPFKFNLIRRFEFDLAKHAAVNIHLSKDTSNWMKENFKVNTKVLYPPLKRAFISNAYKFAQKDHDRLYTPLKLVTFIRISPEKEIERLLQMIKDFSIPFQLKILGEIVNPAYKEKIDDLIHEYHLETKIIFDGRLDLNILIQEIANEDAYIHPARYEPFGISIMEAAFLGLPIILDISDQIGAGELLEDSVSCIRLDFTNAIESEKKLLLFMKNPNKWLQIGKRGQKVAQSLTVEKEINQLIAFITEKI